VDGNDPVAVYEVTTAAVERARSGQGPTLIEAKTYRFRGHYEGDPQVYRKPGEMEQWKKRDPIPTFRKTLADENFLSETELADIEAQVQQQLDEAVAFAAAAPSPRSRSHGRRVR
jgi:pyruvate dehydrogenase E1 component alpha subunit